MPGQKKGVAAITDEQILNSLERLAREVELLQARMTELERRLDELEPGTKGTEHPKHVSLPLAPAQESVPELHAIELTTAETEPAGEPETIPLAGAKETPKEAWEAVVGGRILNRAGIIVLLLATAFFLKYSFDNNWIGPTGRLVIGYIAGIGFLVAGDKIMCRGYRYFSQGFTGGGVAIIYLATYFGMHYYNLIGHWPGFAILVMAASAAGVLAVRQNAYGVGILATLGGFLTPFLVGSDEPNAFMLLSYTAVLDLAVLYLGLHRNWRSLNFLALLGTATVVLFCIREITPADGSTWAYEGFLFLFFLIFGTLVFLHNYRYKRLTGGPELALMLLDSAFFFGFSCSILEDKWQGLLAVFLAFLYVLTALVMRRRRSEDDLLFVGLLGTGMAFVTIAIPLQLDYMGAGENWIAAAWVVEGAALVYGGIAARRLWIRTAGLILLFTASLMAINGTPGRLPVFNFYAAIAAMAVFANYFAALWYQESEEISVGERWIAGFEAIFATVLAMALISSEAGHICYYYKAFAATPFAVSLGWAVLAVILMAYGITSNTRGVRVISLVLLSFTTLKVVFGDLGALSMALKILILAIVGAILLGVSYVYQRIEERETGQ